MEHTPGPWTACCTTINRAITHWHITGKEHGSIYPTCNHTLEVKPDASEQIANAHLIAAAPELLEALEPFAKFACDPPCGCHNCRAKTTIAKAKGE